MKFLSVVALLVALLAVAACEKSSFDFYGPGKKSEQQAGVSEEGVQSKPLSLSSISLATVVLKSGEKKYSVTAEIARTESERAKGLSGRASLSKEDGMLFIFPEEGLEKFWMKDTSFPLDLIYMNKDQKVVDIVTYAVPYDLKLLESKEPFMYVLEVNAGFVKDKNIGVGDKAEIRIGPR